MIESRVRLSEALHAALIVLGEGSPAALTGPELVEASDRLAHLRRLTDAVHSEIAAEIARRSRPELGSDGLSRRNGFRNAGALLTVAMGGSAGDAQRMIQVGEATAARTTLSGEQAPPRRAHVAAALARGELSTWAA